jgi:hypothetical protein
LTVHIGLKNRPFSGERQDQEVSGLQAEAANLRAAGGGDEVVVWCLRETDYHADDASAHIVEYERGRKMGTWKCQAKNCQNGISDFYTEKNGICPKEIWCWIRHTK